jgi:hypothetical protein
MSEQHEHADPADVAEQLTPAGDEDDETSAAATSAPLPEQTMEADEADRLEQSAPVTGEDDEYPYDVESSED